jgi:hypothetical protein
MSTIQYGRQKRPLFSGQKAFREFIVEETSVMPPAKPKRGFLKRLLVAVLLTIATSGTTFLGIWLHVQVLSYVGMSCMFFVIVWFIYSS